MDSKMTSTHFFNFIIKNLPMETNTDLVQDQMKALSYLVDLFIPLD